MCLSRISYTHVWRRDRIARVATKLLTNSFWGGKMWGERGELPTGYLEAVIDQIGVGKYIESNPFH